MDTRKNLLIRQYAAKKKVKLWEVAAKLGIFDTTFTRKLRFELPEDEQKKMLAIIDQIASEHEKED